MTHYPVISKYCNTKVIGKLDDLDVSNTLLILIKKKKVIGTSNRYLSVIIFAWCKSLITLQLMYTIINM